MRKIKFRAKDEYNNEWVYGVPVQDSDIKNRWYLIYGYSDGADRIIVKPETICEYSSFKDSSKSELYERDIIENDGVFYIIEYCEETGSWEAIDVYTGDNISLSELCSSPYTWYQGNSIDNPELLEK